MTPEAAPPPGPPAQPPTPPAVSRRALYTAGVLLLSVAAAIVIMGITTRKTADAKLREWTENEAVPVVAVASPDTSNQTTSLSLPGRLEAYTQAQLYARVNGYVKEWHFDIGARVKAGDLLAVIDAPDLDQQIMQAEANLASAQANSILADATLKRGQSLIKSYAISQQDLDQRSADAANRRGLVRAAQANLDRLRVLEKYKRIVAPFDGLVTSRTTDVGALINAGAGGPPMFVVSKISKLRVYVNVPQSDVPSVPIGTKAEIAVPEYPGRTFPATVEASAQAVDVASGTTRMQLVVGNAAGALMTGDFATVAFQLPHPQLSIGVPASALIFNQNGLSIATVGPDNRVILRQVTISRDLGKEVELASGLAADAHVIINPPDGIATGDEVRVAGSPGAPSSPGAPGTPETADAK